MDEVDFQGYMEWIQKAEDLEDQEDEDFENLDEETEQLFRFVVNSIFYKHGKRF